MIDAGYLRWVQSGPNLMSKLEADISQRPVYVHVDCEVLEPGIVPIEHRDPCCLTRSSLRLENTPVAWPYTSSASNVAG